MTWVLQWIGPNLEVLQLASDQVTVELNSTTDNPLLDPEGQTIHHGGNFQACSPAKAMESARLALQQFGKLSFSQFTELVKCVMCGGKVIYAGFSY
jgi:phenylalanine ammonia-lyase